MTRTTWIPVALAVGLLAFTPSTTGCAASDEEETGEASPEALSAANGDFESSLAEIQRSYERCQSDGKCAAAPPDAAGDVTAQSLQPLTAPTLSGSKLCRALKPFAALESPYFFAGMNGNIAAIRNLKDGGADIVFDLKNEQAAIFRYESREFSNAVGAELNVYAGYAFGRKANVLEAWSGQFVTGDVVIDVPIPLLSAGGKIVRSRDRSIWGGAVEASVGFNLFDLVGLGEVEGSIGQGEREPLDGATRAYGHGLWFVGYREVSARAEGQSHTYLQFNGATGMGAALVQTFGALGFAPAATAAGLAALRTRHLTISQVCR